MIAAVKFAEIEPDELEDEALETSGSNIEYEAPSWNRSSNGRKRATAPPSASWPAGSRAWSTRSPCAGSATTARRKSCARTCSSRRCKRSASSKCRRRSVVGCGRSPCGWRSIAGSAGRRSISTEPQTLEATCTESSTPLDAALANERAAEVRGGLARLGELDRHTLEAFYFRGQSLAEMSKSFAAPVGTIKRRLHVARKRLAEHLEAAAAV